MPDTLAPSATTISARQWQSRPLIVNGWGLRAERVGNVKSVEADDEELWAHAQLDKHHRYREYIARLIEQGSIKADPMRLPHLMKRDYGGRVVRLPVIGIQLSPEGLAA